MGNDFFPQWHKRYSLTRTIYCRFLLLKPLLTTRRATASTLMERTKFYRSKTLWCWNWITGPLTRYATLLVAHAPGMLGTFSPPPQVSDPDIHHGTCVTHVPWCMPGSLTSGSLWNRWWGKRSRHSRRMHNPHFCISGKRPIARHSTDSAG